jgi:hypothetical protein
MQKLLVLLLPAFGVFLIAATSVSTVTHNVTVKRYDAVSYTQKRVDDALSNASDALKKVDAAGDISADVVLKRSGALGTTDVGTGTISSQQDFDALFDASSPAKNRDVRIVVAINWCGKVRSFIGCADIAGHRMVVVPKAADMEGPLWAHEFGHTKGLHHRDATFAVMCPTVTKDSRRLIADEARAYESPSAVTPPAPEPAEPTCNSMETTAAQIVMEPVERFVRHSFEFVPYNIARHYSAAAVDTLVTMLHSAAEREHAANIVAVLGAIGDERAYESIIGVIEMGSQSDASSEAFRAKTSALLALGYLAHHNRDAARPYAYLQIHARPAAWIGTARTPTRLATNRAIASASTALLGIALSGRSDATDFLNAERTRVAAADATPAEKNMRATVDEAIRVAEIVSRVGLAEYYRQAR